MGIKGITVEIGNPQLLQTQFVQWTTAGIMNVLKHFKMISLVSTYYFLRICQDTMVLILHKPKTIPGGKEITVPIICSDAYWIHTRTGGILEVYPDVNTLVTKGDLGW